jgi:hypothetical protein
MICGLSMAQEGQVEEILQIMADYGLKWQKTEYESDESATLISVAGCLDLKETQESKIKEAVRLEHAKLDVIWAKAYCEEHRQAVKQSIEAKGDAYVKEVKLNQACLSTEHADALVQVKRKKVLPDVLKLQLGEQLYAEWMSHEKAVAQLAIRSFSMMLVSELDEELNLQPEQRKKLEPLVLEKFSQVIKQQQAKELFNQLNSNKDFLGFTEMLPRVKLLTFLDAKQVSLLDELYAEHETEWQRLKERFLR